MLLDVLGVLTAFCGALLLLSLVVTALAQSIQAGLRLRGRTLLHGVEAALAVAKSAESEFDEKQVARQVVEQADGLRPHTVGPQPPSSARRLLGPRRTWLGEQELRSVVESMSDGETSAESPVLDAHQVDQVVAEFARLDGQLRKRFAWHMRVVSVACAAAVAIAFQVDALALLQKLSASPEYRAAVAREASALVASEYGKPADSGKPSERDSEEAAVVLARLMGRHPDLTAALAPIVQAKGSSDSSRDALRTALAARPEVCNGTLAEFDDAMELENFRNAAERTGRLTRQMSLLDFTPWPDARFFDDPRRLFGILVTIILLTLGAPFWYGLLKRAGSIGDSLTKPRPRDKPREAM